MDVRVGPIWYEHHKDELDVLVELLQIDPICLEPSVYQGVVLVLGWNPNYRAITVVGLGTSRIYLYSKTPFKGAVRDFDYWELTL